MEENEWMCIKYYRLLYLEHEEESLLINFLIFNIVLHWN